MKLFNLIEHLQSIEVLSFAGYFTETWKVFRGKEKEE